MTRPSESRIHPATLRWPILATAVMAMATWWGLGLPYSLYSWLLDEDQLRWVLICYAWEVPVAGGLGPVLFPALWFRRIERRWDAVFGHAGPPDLAAAAALERTILDFPIRVAGVMLVTSVVGYGIGALQVWGFADLPAQEVVKICALGLATGLIGGLFAFLYLESLLAPLLRRFAELAPEVPPAGRRVPLHQKVFACSIVMTLTALLLLGTVFYSRGERLLEEEVGRRVLGESRRLAAELAAAGAATPGAAWWQERTRAMRLGPSGYAYAIDASGRVYGGDGRVASLADEGLRPSVGAALRAGREARRVDRTHTQRLVSVATIGDTPNKVVAVVARGDFEDELDAMLRDGIVIFGATLLLALLQGFLFSRRLTRPIEVLTGRASAIAQRPGGPWETVPVRTNDEVGTLALAFNQMIGRLEGARTDLEQRIMEATRNVATLYEVARTTTSTLEIADVLALVAEKTLASLGLAHLVLLWRPPDLGDVVDAYAADAAGHGERLEVDPPIDPAALCDVGGQPGVHPRPPLPEALAARLPAARVLSLPLVFQDRLLGVILAGLEDGTARPDLVMASALARQAAAALANAGLFETIRRKEAELRKLSQMRVRAQEENLRALSRELHDGFGQVLTVVNMELGMIERAGTLDPGLRARVRDAREQVMHLLQEVRSMSQVLRPPALDFGLVPTIRWLAERFARSTQIQVDVATPPEEMRLPADIELVLYRVTQEALTNVARHARATRVTIELTVRDGSAVLAITDDGIGFEADRFRRTPSLAGVGLLGMRERVAYFNGTLDVRSRPSAGVRITVTLPLAEPYAEPGALAIAGERTI